MEKEITHSIGKRDAVAEILMAIRIKKGDVKSVILDLADQLLKHDSDHPHAKWVKDNI